MDTRFESEFANPDLEILITSEQVNDRIRAIGAEMARDYAGKSPLFIGLIPSAGFFLGDLVRATDIPLGIEFMAIDNGVYSPGEIRILKDLDVAIEGRHVVVVQILVDTGFTESYLLSNLKARGAASVKLVSLLDNFELREKEVAIDYLGFKIPNLTVVGCGLGFAARFRNLPYLAVLTISDGEGIVPIYEKKDFSGTCVIIAPDFELISAELIEYFSTHPDDIYKLDPRKFEILLEAVFRNQGYRTELGRGWSDGGVDLRLYQKDSIGEICTLVQAKRYKHTSPIRLEAVASLAALVDDEKANRGLFVTTSRFLPGVQKFAEKQSRRITLANSIDIAKWCEEVARRNPEQ